MHWQRANEFKLIINYYFIIYASAKLLMHWQFSNASNLTDAAVKSDESAIQYHYIVVNESAD